MCWPFIDLLLCSSFTLPFYTNTSSSLFWSRLHIVIWAECTYRPENTLLFLLVTAHLFMHLTFKPLALDLDKYTRIQEVIPSYSMLIVSCRRSSPRRLISCVPYFVTYKRAHQHVTLNTSYKVFSITISAKCMCRFTCNQVIINYFCAGEVTYLYFLAYLPVFNFKYSCPTNRGLHQ